MPLLDGERGDDEDEGDELDPTDVADVFRRGFLAPMACWSSMPARVDAASTAAAFSSTNPVGQSRHFLTFFRTGRGLAGSAFAPATLLLCCVLARVCLAEPDTAPVLHGEGGGGENR